MKYIALIVATVATLTTAAAVAKSAAAAGGSVPVYYLIRHAEKNPDGTISADGKKREQCLIRVFGKESKYNIQHIMVQKYHPGGCYIPPPLPHQMKMFVTRCTNASSSRYRRRPYYTAAV